MAERPDQDPHSQDSHSDAGQVDPLLREGRVGRWALWALAAAIALVLAIVIYTVTVPRPNGPAGPGERVTTSAPPRPAATNGSGPDQTGR